MNPGTEYVKLLEDLRKDCLSEHTPMKFLERICSQNRHFWLVNDNDNFRVKYQQLCACGKAFNPGRDAIY